MSNSTYSIEKLHGNLTKKFWEWEVRESCGDMSSNRYIFKTEKKAQKFVEERTK